MNTNKEEGNFVLHAVASRVKMSTEDLICFRKGVLIPLEQQFQGVIDLCLAEEVLAKAKFCKVDGEIFLEIIEVLV